MDNGLWIVVVVLVGGWVLFDWCGGTGIIGIIFFVAGFYFQNTPAGHESALPWFLMLTGGALFVVGVIVQIRAKERKEDQEREEQRRKEDQAREERRRQEEQEREERRREEEEERQSEESLEHKEQLRERLIAVAETGNLDGCKTLISQGADFYGEDEGCNVLLAAASSGNVELGKYFISLGANVDDALYKAASLGSVDDCKYFVSLGADVNNTILHDAACSGNVELCKYFVSLGADVNNTILHDAACGGNVELCKYFVSLGVNVDKTILHYSAAYSGNVEVCKYFVSLGADVNAVDGDGKTILHNAASSGNVEICKYFISMGLDVNARDNNGETILHTAAFSGNVEVCKYLISLGLDVNARDDTGKTVLDHADKYNTEVRQYLISQGAKESSVLSDLLLWGKESCSSVIKRITPSCKVERFENERQTASVKPSQQQSNQCRDEDFTKIQNDAYVQALKEIESDNCDPCAKAKAIVESQGNSEQMKALYIKIRVEDIVAQYSAGQTGK